MLSGQPLVSEDADGLGERSESSGVAVRLDTTALDSLETTSPASVLSEPIADRYTTQDTIKTRAQTAPKGQFSGPLDIAVQTIKKEGFLGLYKGMASPLLGVAGVNSLLFASNAYARKLVSPYGPNLSIREVATAGAIAGAAQSILASPVEMFKVRFSVFIAREEES